ncbi:MAG: PAS domain-containing protein [Syntrophobacteraceae bacterium]
MRGWRSRLSLRTVILFLVLLSVLPTLLLAFYSNFEQRSLGFVELQTDLERMIRLEAATQGRLIEGGRALLLALAQLDEVQEPDKVECNELFGNLVNKYGHYTVLGVVDVDGAVQCSSLPVMRPVDFNKFRWFRETLDSAEFVVSGLEQDPITLEPTIFLSYPVFDRKGALKAVAFGGLNLTEIDHSMFDAGGFKDTVFFFLDLNGSILTLKTDRGKSMERSLGGKRLIKTILSNQVGILRDEQFDGIDRLYSYTRLQDPVETPLFICFGSRTKTALQKAERLLMRNLLGLVIVACIALLVAWLFGKHFIVKRVTALLAVTGKLASGDMSIRSEFTGGMDEFSALARAFNEMVASLETKTLQLRHAEERYRSLVEQIPAVTYMYSLDPQSPPIFFSPQVKRLLGLTPEECQSMPDCWINQIHPDDRDYVLAASWHGGGNRDKSSFHLEYRMLTRDGRTMWVSDEAVPEYDEEGMVRFIRGLAVDVSERHNAEEVLFAYQGQLRSLASQLSMAEEQERRRIALQLHDSIGQKLAILRIKLETLMSGPSGEYQREQLAALHELLAQIIQETRSMTYRISSPILYELGLEAALEWLAEESEKQYDLYCTFSTDGEPKPLSDEVRGLLFQAVNELLINVSKHAKVNECRIDLRREGDFVLASVEDDGVGFVVAQIVPHWCRRGGYGLFSIRERLTGIGGSFKLESEPGKGTRVTLVAPLAVEAQPLAPESENRREECG